MKSLLTCKVEEDGELKSSRLAAARIWNIFFREIFSTKLDEILSPPAQSVLSRGGAQTPPCRQDTLRLPELFFSPNIFINLFWTWALFEWFINIFSKSEKRSHCFIIKDTTWQVSYIDKIFWNWDHYFILLAPTPITDPFPAWKPPLCHKEPAKGKKRP